jgi:hypothetical protein
MRDSVLQASVSQGVASQGVASRGVSIRWYERSWDIPVGIPVGNAAQLAASTALPASTSLSPAQPVQCGTPTTTDVPLSATESMDDGARRSKSGRRIAVTTRKRFSQPSRAQRHRR